MGEAVRGGAYNLVLSFSVIATERLKWSRVYPHERSFRFVLADDSLEDLPPTRGSGPEIFFHNFRYGVERGQILPGNR